MRLYLALAVVLAPSLASSISSAATPSAYDGQWPPYASSQCTSANAFGELSKRGLNERECNQLILDEGRPLAARAAVELGFYFYDFGLWDVDSAGGVEPHAWIVNANPNTSIKYVTMTIRMFNAVGDAVRSSIGNQGSFSIRFTGPLANDEGPKQAHWDPVGYNHSAKCLQMESVSIEFMNGKSVRFSGKSLRKAFHPSVKYTCKP